ncbi:hypothetical protein BGX28_009616 [Mortierella sp. GBA30]|nr:hypothetical protein BGX28_009616 [Mortierella sp. GBA30]
MLRLCVQCIRKSMLVSASSRVITTTAECRSKVLSSGRGPVKTRSESSNKGQCRALSMRRGTVGGNGNKPNGINKNADSTANGQHCRYQHNNSKRKKGSAHESIDKTTSNADASTTVHTPSKESSTSNTLIPEQPMKNPHKKAIAAATKPLLSSLSSSENTSETTSPKKRVATDHQDIPDFKYSRTHPHQDLDNLQLLVDELLSTNSYISKRDILAQHPNQAPLLAWIYDPLRQFNVRPSNVLKYALLRARQRDETVTARSSTTAPSSSSSSLSSSAPSPSSTTSKKQKAEAEARAMAIGQGYETLSELLNALSTRAVSGHTALDAILLFMDRFCQDRNNSNHYINYTVSSSPRTSRRPHSSYSDAVDRLFTTPRSKLLLKILDKNLKTGCNIGMIREIYPNLIPEFHVALGQSLLHLEDARTLLSDSPSPSPPLHKAAPASKKSKRAKNQTGVSYQVSDPDVPEVSIDNASGWFASRKLDGVRCLMRIDRTTGGIETLSRTGRTFESLGKLQEALRVLISNRRNGNSGTSSIEQRSRDLFFASAMGMEAGARVKDEGESSSSSSSSTERTEMLLPESLILDGEVCVFLTDPAQESSIRISERAPNNNGGGDALENGRYSYGDEDEFGRENFTRTVKFVKRGLIEEEQGQNQSMSNEDNMVKDDNEHMSDKDKRQEQGQIEELENSLNTGNGLQIDTIAPAEAGDRAVYCIFDCLTDKEFRERRGSRRFSERIDGLKSALGQNKDQDTVTAGARSLIRILNQTKIESFPQLENMVATGLERGWEGIMLRKDVGYEGKRSRNLLKIKQFQEAEFTVQEAMLGSMRIHFQGEVKERDNVLTNVVVLHRGNKVRVGSGFSVEDRIRFGKDPNLIIGKTITVQFFEESKTFSGSSGAVTTATPEIDQDTPSLSTGEHRDKEDENLRSEDTGGDGGSAVWSLRFPTVKAIYGSGPRQL